MPRRMRAARSVESVPQPPRQGRGPAGAHASG
jgi:hypothetical protein